MKQQALEMMIRRVVEERIADDRVVSVPWLVQEVLSSHSAIEGDDKDFYLLCGREHLKDTVRQVLRAYGPDPEDELDQQEELPGIIMDGCVRLRKAYLLERAGQHLIVPVTQMTVRELREKAAEYRRMGLGCYEHADELDRYANMREVA